ncbi:hypothetical protein AB8S08_05235 [Pseudidiomarina sp. PP-1MA]|uniref:Lipoprotein n=1 Tax=Pseudidiomarina sp. PP-1MA TaxID=3237706 RepID=A0AB39XA80_9GAMM
MMNRQLAISLSSLLVLSSCASWEAEHREAVARSSAHHWQKLMEQHHTQPTASGPKWQMPDAQAEAYANYLEQLPTPRRLLEVTGGKDCALNELSQTFVVHQQAPELVERQRKKTAKSVDVEQRGRTVTIISGDCSLGELNGPVTALYTDNYYSQSQYIAGETQFLGRIDGFFKKGRLHGEARVISIDKSNSSGNWRESLMLKIGMFDNGSEVGPHLMIYGEGENQVITLTQSLQDNYVRMNSWMSGKPNTRFHMLNGEIEGWLEFASSVLKDDPQCYRMGQKVENPAYCQQVAPRLEQLMPVAVAAELPRLASFNEMDTIPAAAPRAATPAVPAAPNAPTAPANPTSPAPQQPIAQSTWSIPRIPDLNWLTMPNLKQLYSARANEYIPRLQQQLLTNMVQYLTPKAGPSCVLNDDSTSYLLFQLSKSDYEQQRNKQRSRNNVYTDGQPSIMVAEGACENGQLDGDFVVMFRYPHSLKMGAYQASSNIYGRIEGTFVDGKLHGEISRTWLTQHQPGSMGATEIAASLSIYQHGQRDGEEIHVIAIPNSRSTRVVKLTPYSVQREKADIWLNGRPQLSSMMNLGVIDGYVKYYDGSLSNLVQCFQDGIPQTNDNYCKQLGF